VTHVIHAAATVSFDEPLATCRRVNVEGTRHVLALAEAAEVRGGFRRFCHVSTAYVAGCRTGLVREDELETGQRFRNGYEKSKLEAEVLLQQRVRDLPIVITRPSIIVGSAETGSTTSFKTMYWPLRVYATRRWRVIPGIPQATIDMIPVDFVARAVAHLTFAGEAAGRTFHLCAGPEGSATLGDLGAFAATFFGVPPPRFVNPVVFAAAVRPLALLFLSRRRAQVLRAGRVYRPYLSMRLNFDLTGTRDVLMPAGLTPPRVVDYVERLFRYCVDSDWGRRPIRRES
jgi:long-chain acyl-CoA synthetase